MLIDDLILYAELLIYLSGTFLYGFVARQLLRDPVLMRRNQALRALAICVTGWYAGCLIDVVLTILAPGGPWLGTFLDVGRGMAWLAVFPFLAHAAWRFLAVETSVAKRPSVLWLAPGYLMLGLFLPASFDYWRSGSVRLQDTAGELFVPVVVHATASATIAGWLLVSLLRRSRDPGLVQFLRWMLAAVALVLAATAMGLVCLRPSTESGRIAELWRTSAQAVGLGPGLVLLYFVQHYSLLRLTLPLRTVRHFLATVALVVVVMLAGLAVRAEGSELFRRLIAWGVLTALVGGTAYSAVLAMAARRWTAVRRLIEPSVPTWELEDLAGRIRTLEADERELREITVAELSRWLGTGVRFLPSPAGGEPPAIRTLWEFFADPGQRGCDRVDAPPALAGVLATEELYAAFPLRVGSELVGVLVVEAGIAGGGVREGEKETIQLVLRQLAGVLELRRQVEARIAAERRLAEQERLGTLGLVAASLAHEIKNPLTSMKALAQTVHEELAATGPESEQVEDLGVIVEQIDRLQEVTREILGFARPSEGDESDLAALVTSALYVLRPEARRLGTTIAATTVAQVGLVPGSPATWQAVVFNLILNAVEHAPAGSEVVARLVRDPAGTVVFETENAGPAIAEEIAGRLFEPFVSDGGTGLGLAIAAQRVRSLGGRIECVNEPGRIRFRVELGGEEG
ncbi:MAG: hypothetical protein GY856_03900 [bacterium]|nr:hypothetical protein [bacterium]